MKHFNEPFWNGNRDLPDCGAVPQLHYILVNCKIGEKFIVFYLTEICITVFTIRANSLSVRSIPAGYNLFSHSFKIYIITIVSSTQISFKTCLLIRHSG